MTDIPSATSLPRVIFVDGLPGSGKSTTAQRLCLHLNRHGHPARWIFEHEDPHPVFPEPAVRACRTQAADADPTLFTRALTGYATLARELTDRPGLTLLLEGTLFQTAVGTQVLTDQSRSTIDAFFDRTLATLAPHQTALIQLRAPDVAASLQHTAEKRGDWFPEFLVGQLAATPLGQRHAVTTWDGAVALLAQHRAVCDELFDRFPGPKLSVDPTAGDWSRRNAAFTDFLGLPALTEPEIAAACNDFVGTYRADGTDTESELILTPEGLALAGPPSARLWARPDGSFEVEGIAMELTFRRDDSGNVTGFTCAPRLTELPLTWHRI
ncbi:hypothetical protein [Synoicihabitans lomoniglobus]|uniref:Uncharacterized protein n=1 Tax=Synoicihabitans lomoniglobus TaxID=2909285 RepID=A0AAE9ZVB1_9BACT|nr:hypothetical protein [Opitutaceae bacterium LMO-M01]WED65715.1 hypothetical protein PXH66_02495 [Opitutaceae bacterium LMO-M01]